MNLFTRFSSRHRRPLIALAVGALFLAGVLVGREGEKDPPQAKPAGGLVATAHAASPIGGADSASDGQALPPIPHVFDPNEVDSVTLVACGIEPWKARMFLHYRDAGKQFYSENDLLATYGWQREDVERLRPYLRFGERPSRAPRYEARPLAQADYPYDKDSRLRGRDDGEAEGESPKKSDKFTELTLVDINTADTATLRRIPGIGPYYARQVVGLRERLGGYTHVEQVLEIRNFPAEAVDWLRVSDPTPQRRLRLTDDISTLARHPYVGLRRARALHEWHDLYGAIPDSAALSDTRIFSPGELRLLLPYIEF